MNRGHAEHGGKTGLCSGCGQGLPGRHVEVRDNTATNGAVLRLWFCPGCWASTRHLFADDLQRERCAAVLRGRWRLLVG